MCTHLNLISTLFFHTSVSIQRAQTRKHKGIRASGYSIMRSRIDLYVHSPKFNLHTVLPHIRLDPESAQPESQRHQDTAWEALATVMRGGTDLHVHSPKFNIHATHPSRSRERKPAGSTKASGHRATVMRSGTDMHVHSPQFNLHAVFPHVCAIQRAQTRKHKGIRASGYSNERQNRFACALT